MDMNYICFQQMTHGISNACFFMKVERRERGNLADMFWSGQNLRQKENHRVIEVFSSRQYLDDTPNTTCP